MKIRTGFVSNSSSTSFCIGFKKKIESIEQLAEELGEVFTDDEDVSFREVVTALFKALKNPMSVSKAIEIVKPDVDPETLDKYRVFPNEYTKQHRWDYYCDDISHIRYEFSDKFEQAARKLANIEFIRDNANSVFYAVEFDDKDPVSCVLESGRMFYNIPHRSKNNH